MRVMESIESHCNSSFRGLVFAVKQLKMEDTAILSESLELSDLLKDEDLTFVSCCFL